jgi:hypothetical protein
LRKIADKMRDFAKLNENLVKINPKNAQLEQI